VSARSKARKQTLDLLYESDIRSSDLLQLLASRDVEEDGPDARPIREYTKSLIEGIYTHKRKIDELITTYAQGWDMDRMPAIDRNILRIALFEILFKNDLDDQVAASEAVEIASELSTEDSAKYINGVLGRIIVLKPSFAL
jgi:N utilization substance protein B